MIKDKSKKLETGTEKNQDYYEKIINDTFKYWLQS